MHLLDTDTLTHLHSGNPKVIERLRTSEDLDVGTTIVTGIEILRSRIDYILKAETGTDLLRTQQLLARTEELLAQILTVPLDLKSAERFDYLRSTRSLRKVGRADLLISSIALSNRATLVTRNLKHFKQIPGLKVEN